MDSEWLFKFLCILLLCVYGALILYYSYILRKVWIECNSEKDDIPCPNTCNPGYECTQSETPTEFTIGDVVEESVLEEVEQPPESTESTVKDETIRLDV